MALFAHFRLYGNTITPLHAQISLISKVVEKITICVVFLPIRKNQKNSPKTAFFRRFLTTITIFKEPQTTIYRSAQKRLLKFVNIRLFCLSIIVLKIFG